MHRGVLKWMLEREETLVSKVDKGLVEDVDFWFGQQAWQNFDDFLKKDGVVF